ncbi:MAG: Eco57I restriction-modification methylase domain-containing protein [Candidatus Hodarchaeales archaeon]|jgi:SAM-dependent methyltransferase
MKQSNKPKLSEFPLDYLKRSLKQCKLESEHWLQFFDLLLNHSEFNRVNKHLEKPEDGLALLGFIENLFLFFNRDSKNHKIILRKCQGVIDQLNVKRTKMINIIVFNASKHELIIILASYNHQLSGTTKLLKFPHGKIPLYYRDLLVFGREISPYDLILQIMDTAVLELDFVCYSEKRFQTLAVGMKADMKKNIIIYLVLLLICSELRISKETIHQLIVEKRNTHVCSLSNFFLILQQFSRISSINDSLLKEFESSLLNEKYQSFPIDLSIIQDFLERYIFSICEPSRYVKEIAISPYTLSVIEENLSGSPRTKKMEGKYYTHLQDADFINRLSIYRLFKQKISGIAQNDPLEWIFQDLESKIYSKRKIHIQTIALPPYLDILDPACGSGTFLISIARLMYQIGRFNTNLTKMMVTLWGIELNPEAILVTKLRLTFLKWLEIQNYSSLKNNKAVEIPVQLDFSNIICADFLFHSFPKKFDLIIGNPPFVRHEDIGSVHQLEYKKAIQSHIKELINGNLVIDRKSDLYIYFCILGLSLLKFKGILAFLTSNAWLEVEYGRSLQNFLLDHQNKINCFDIFFRSGKRLWNQLGINSIILFAEKKDSNNHTFTNGMFIDSKVDFSLISGSSLKEGVLSRRDYEDNFYRSEIVSRRQLKKTNKWAGTFIRTSRTERKILKKISSRGVPLSSLADVRFGLKTGANDFFHIQIVGEKTTHDNTVRFKNRMGYEGTMEKKYLIPLLKSPTHVRGFVVSSSYKFKLWLFQCREDQSQLQGSEAWKYIEWGESIPIMIKQGRHGGNIVKGFPSLHSVRTHEPWYSLPIYQAPNLLWTKSYHDKPGCFLNYANSIPDQRFYSINVKENKYIPIIFTYLNSSLVWAQMEAHGNTNMGYGVLDTNVYWLKSLKIPIEAIKSEKELFHLMKGLKKEEPRYKIIKLPQIQHEIDEFYTKILGLSNNSLKNLHSYNFRLLSNRIT